MATSSLHPVSTHTHNVFSRLNHQMGALDAALRSIEKKYLILTARMIQLEKAGITDATPFYQQGKYLYLIHPMRKGKRLREYIGSDVQKRRDAEVKIANTKIFREYFSTLTSLELQAQTILRALQRLTEPKQRNKRSQTS